MNQVHRERSVNLKTFKIAAFPISFHEIDLLNRIYFVCYFYSISISRADIFSFFPEERVSFLIFESCNRCLLKCCYARNKSQFS